MLIKSLRPKVRDAYATEILGEREFLFIPGWHDIGAELWVSVETRARPAEANPAPRPLSDFYPIHPQQPSSSLVSQLGTVWERIRRALGVQPSPSFEAILAAEKEDPVEYILVVSGQESPTAGRCERRGNWLQIPARLPEAQFAPPTGLVPPLPGSFVGGKPQWLHPASLYASPKASTEQNLLDRVLQAEAVDLRRVEDKIELRPFNGEPSTLLKPHAVGHVVVSYAREDTSVVDELIDVLGQYLGKIGVQVWFDRQIGVGSDWKQELAKRFSTAEAAIFLISPASVAPGCFWVREEARFALKSEVTIVPIALVDNETDDIAELDVIAHIHAFKMTKHGEKERWLELLRIVEKKLPRAEHGYRPPSR